MTDQELLHDIKLKRDLHSVITHLQIVAARLILLESSVAGVKKHLGLSEKADESQK